MVEYSLPIFSAVFFVQFIYIYKGKQLIHKIYSLVKFIHFLSWSYLQRFNKQLVFSSISCWSEILKLNRSQGIWVDDLLITLGPYV